MSKGLEGSFSKDIQMANKHIKNAQHDEPSGKCKSNHSEMPLHTPQDSYHFLKGVCVEQRKESVGKGVGKFEPWCFAARM